MQEILLNAKVRDKTGTGISRRMRRQGRVPAIVYGKKGSSLSLDVEEREFEKTAGMVVGHSSLINLKLDKDVGENMVLVKEVQRHPVTERLLHIDFYRISLKDKITVSVPVVVTGESAGVKVGGILEHILWEVKVECLPTQMPDKIEVDITPLKIGDTVHVRDLEIEEGVNFLTTGEKTVISVVPPTVVKEEEVVEEEVAEPERIGEKEREERVGKEKEEKGEKEKESKAEEKKEDGGEKKAPKK